MGIGRQAKLLTRTQIDTVLGFLRSKRLGLRNEVIFLLSVRAGLRAKEIAHLKWAMVLDPDGEVGQLIQLPNQATKGSSGRMIPVNKTLRAKLAELFDQERARRGFEPTSAFVITTACSQRTSAQVIVNMFQRWYRAAGLIGCSSHSGRRTFITNAARKISTVGGSIRDVQQLAGHSSLQTTQRYIDGDGDAQRRVVDLLP